MSGKSKRIHPGEILRQIDEGRLLLFLETYARRHPEFIFEYISRFAPELQIGADEDKYEYIFYRPLNQLMPMGTTPTKSKIVRLNSLYKTLGDHARDKMSLEQYKESFIIIQNGIIYSKLLAKRLESSRYNSHAYDMSSLFHRLLGQLINQVLPPPLIDEIRDFCIDQSLVYDYQPTIKDYNLHDIAFRLIQDAEYAKQYLTQLVNKLTGDYPFDSSLQLLKSIIILRSLEWKDYSLISDLYNTSYLTPKDLAGAVEDLLSSNKNDGFLFLFDLLSVSDTSVTYREVCKFLLLNYEKVKKRISLEKLLSGLPVSDPKIKLLLNIVTNGGFSDKDKIHFYNLVLEELEIASNDEGMIRWMLYHKDYDKLENLMEMSDPDSSFLIEILNTRIPSDVQANLQIRLIQKIKSNLDQTFGIPGTQYLQHVLNDLRRHNQSDLAASVLSEMRRKFPERRSLKTVL